MILDRKIVLVLYKKMLMIRLVEESLVEPIISGAIRTPVHLCSGQEAVAVGMCALLKQDDFIFGNHRSHGHYIAKGGCLMTMIAEIYCKRTGCARGRGGSMHLIDPDQGVMGIVPIVAGTISLATGAALAQSLKHQGNVTVSFFGDGATGEGALFESLNFAALKKLPIIFACENNLYSTHLPISEIRVNSNISETATPFGISTFRVDGNDVIQVYNVSLKAIELCRNGQGPVFIEFLTYRMRGHVGPDDNIQGSHTDIRPKSEVEEWKLKDPILTFKMKLIETFGISSEELNEIELAIKKEIEMATEFALKSQYPDKSELMDYIYAQ